MPVPDTVGRTRQYRTPRKHYWTPRRRMRRRTADDSAQAVQTDSAGADRSGPRYGATGQGWQLAGPTCSTSNTYLPAPPIRVCQYQNTLHGLPHTRVSIPKYASVCTENAEARSEKRAGCGSELGEVRAEGFGNAGFRFEVGGQTGRNLLGKRLAGARKLIEAEGGEDEEREREAERAENEVDGAAVRLRVPLLPRPRLGATNP
eukprot:2901125-Rhodomonas_salina.1